MRHLCVPQVGNPWPTVLKKFGKLNDDSVLLVLLFIPVLLILSILLVLHVLDVLLTFLSRDLVLQTLVEDPVDVGQPDVVRAVLGPAGVVGQTVDQGCDVVLFEKVILIKTNNTCEPLLKSRKGHDIL